MAMKAVPTYSEKYLNQNRQGNTASLTQKISVVEPAGFRGYANIAYIVPATLDTYSGFVE
ncbi:MAG: hypothetical protein G5663_00965 [Serratia symbiotica]|nr:hypothetical protein [Serratia symbiotica]